MPIRKIPKNYRSVTGTFPSIKNRRSVGYESLLERDFFLLLEFDLEVEKYEEQPFSTEYERNGRFYRYTPDCLVHYKDLNRLPCVFEIKFSDEIKTNKVFFEEKFNKLDNYLMKNDMEFKLFTEIQIRTDFLKNASFLYRFAFLRDELKLKKVLSALVIEECIQVTALLERIDVNKFVQIEYLPFVWLAIFRKLLLTDLNEPLTNSSLVRLVSHV